MTAEQLPRRIAVRVAFLALSAAVVVPLLLVALASPTRAQSEERDSLYKYLSVFTEVLRLVRGVYVEETSLPDLMASALDGAADALDPFSVYVPADAVEKYRRAREVHRRRCGMLVIQQRGVAHVVAVDPGGPAETSEIKVGDIVAKVGGMSTRGMPLWQLRTAFAGDRGNTLTLELLRRGVPVQKTISLAEFTRPPVVRRVVEGVSVVRIPQLEQDAVAALDRELAALAADTPLVLDLRGTVEGDPEAAFALAERFTTGALGTLRRGSEVVRRFESVGAARHRGPLALLVDSTSLGAAEIVATVLQQKKAASVVGEPTFGYAGRSELVRLASGAYLEVTVAFFAGPDGTLLRQSVEPDEVIWSAETETGDPAADEALKRAIDLLLGRTSAPAERKVA